MVYWVSKVDVDDGGGALVSAVVLLCRFQRVNIVWVMDLYQVPCHYPDLASVSFSSFCFRLQPLI